MIPYYLINRPDSMLLLGSKLPLQITLSVRLMDDSPDHLVTIDNTRTRIITQTHEHKHSNTCSQTIIYSYSMNLINLIIKKISKFKKTNRCAQCRKCDDRRGPTQRG